MYNRYIAVKQIDRYKLIQKVHAGDTFLKNLNILLKNFFKR